MKVEQTVIDSDSGIPCKFFSMSPSLESWHNCFAAIQAIDQTDGMFLGFLGGVENYGVVSFELQVCLYTI